MSGLPERPDLDQLRHQARELLRAAADGEPRAVDRLRAVSPHVALSAAQLALAREYGFQSWAALKTEVARRRSPALPEDRWSFGSAAALRTPVGVWLPEILMAGASQAILHGSLALSGNGQRQFAAPPAHRWPAWPGALLADLVPPYERWAIRRKRAEMSGMRKLLGTTTIVDARGAQYAHRGGGGSGQPGTKDMLVHLRMDPVPGREIEWIELRGHDGTTARLLRSPRATARIGQLGPVGVAEARRAVMPGAVPRAGGPQFHRDIGTDLPAVDGVSIRLDSLISLPGSWLLYVRALPRWRNYNQAGQREREDLVWAHAEDDRGGSYLGSYARSTRVLTGEEMAACDAGEGIKGPEELALRFLPCLDPLARVLKLTFQGAREEITVDLEIGACG